LEGKEHQQQVHEQKQEEEDEEEQEEEEGGWDFTRRPSEKFVGVKPVNTSHLEMAIGHATSCGRLGEWPLEKIVPMASGMVNCGR